MKITTNTFSAVIALLIMQSPVAMAEFGMLWRERKVSLLNTRPSTILKIEQKAVPWPIVATDSLDGSTVYVHVLTPPDGKSINLPALADARKIISASLLLGGNEVKFKQTEKAVVLSLPEEVKWDSVDTVIVLKVGAAFEPGVILSAEEAKSSLVPITTEAVMRNEKGEPIYDCLEPHIAMFGDTWYAYGFTIREKDVFAATCYSSTVNGESAPANAHDRGSAPSMCGTGNGGE